MGTSPARLPKEASIDRLWADTVTVMLMSLVAAAAVIFLAVRKYLSLFTPEGIVWNLPIEPQSGAGRSIADYIKAGPVYSEAIDGAFTQLQVVISHPSTAARVLLTLSIAWGTLAALVIIACTARIAWLLLKGRFFTVPARRALRLLNIALILGTALTVAFWQFAGEHLDDQLGATSTQRVQADYWAWYCVVIFAISSFGLVDTAIRRAIRLQHETEGLV